MEHRLASLLPARQINLDIRSDDKEAAIKEVAASLSGHRAMLAEERFFAEIFERESLASTCIGHGVALPHARTEAVDDLIMAAGRSKAGVRFQNELVHLVFVLGTPLEMIREYLMVVGELARLLKSAAVREALLTAQTSDDFARILREA